MKKQKGSLGIMVSLGEMLAHLLTLKPYELVIFVIVVLCVGSIHAYLFFNLIKDSIKIYKNEDEKVPCKADGFLWK
jgi:uncharacterized membrane protein